RAGIGSCSRTAGPARGAAALGAPRPWARPAQRRGMAQHHVVSSARAAAARAAARPWALDAARDERPHVRGLGRQAGHLLFALRATSRAAVRLRGWDTGCPTAERRAWSNATATRRGTRSG